MSLSATNGSISELAIHVHCIHEKLKQCTIENVKSERILTKLRVLDYEYICDRKAMS